MTWADLRGVLARDQLLPLFTPDGQGLVRARLETLQNAELTARAPQVAGNFAALLHDFSDLRLETRNGRRLREHLASFLRAVVPEAVRLANHPDAPPWPMLGLPRVVSTAANLDFLVGARPDEHHGLTFCTGSLGARADNNLPALARRYAAWIHFVHARNVRRSGEQDFQEVAHLSAHGDVKLARAVMLLERLRPAQIMVGRSGA
ncbi:mannonate dehydratase [Deinococcus sp. AJ005]|uniref:mannonate dehydratase n=1 Tax=Deinococcus sp. AJ005 TaxID=2652443 RepID=UPI00125CB6B0|nr:mannonate dehydratase [Deinococcus sp. AJ005]QFP75284.1 hypothetical protein DAAJ005_01680 [Deinococcus sp. AJ005]